MNELEEYSEAFNWLESEAETNPRAQIILSRLMELMIEHHELEDYIVEVEDIFRAKREEGSEVLLS